MKEIGFGLTGMTESEKVSFEPTRMAWNRESRFWPDWNGLNGESWF
jgi:hypothetical protein